jgi:hypothetical protein
MPKDFRRIFFSAVFALIAGVITYAVQTHKDAIFIYHAKPSVSFTSKVDPVLAQAADAAIQSRFPTQTCVSEWVGRDDRFVYVTGGCGIFTRVAGEIKVTGDANIEAFRYRIDGEKVYDEDVVNNHNFENSLARLYPKEAASLARIHMNPDLFRDRGMAKAELKK